MCLPAESPALRKLPKGDSAPTISLQPCWLIRPCLPASLSPSLPLSLIPSLPPSLQVPLQPQGIHAAPLASYLELLEGEIKSLGCRTLSGPEKASHQEREILEILSKSFSSQG